MICRPSFARIAVFLTTLCLQPVAFATAGEPELYTFEGMLGHSRIGMTLWVTNGKVGEGSHYFYQAFLKDIPLTGSVGSDVKLQEPGSGQFILHYRSTDPTPPTDMYHSNGLTGHWASNSKSYQVALDGGGPSTPYAPGHRYADATDLSDAEFEAQVQGFYRNVMKNDHTGTAKYVSFPLRVNTGPNKYHIIKTAAQLSNDWSHVFTREWIASMANQLPHDMAIVRDQVMLGAGLAFINRKGLVEVINMP